MSMTMDKDALSFALRNSSKETQQFLSPLLHLQPVQYLLSTFLSDPTRTFEQSVWDPSTQAVLRKLETISMDPDVTKELTAGFAAEISKASYTPSIECWKEQMDEKHADGKRLFKKQNWYPAKNAFKESIEALYQVHKQESGKDCEPKAWQQNALRERYVTLCCNLAVCALKLKDPSDLKTYAKNALAVNAHCRKAMLGLTHAYIMEHRFGKAREVIDNALGVYENDKELLKTRQEIDTTEQKETEEKIALAALKLKRDAEEAERLESQKLANAERIERLTRTQEVTPLPIPQRDGAAQRLHKYFSKIKHTLVVEFNQLHKPSAGEPPLFECNLVDEVTGIPLATGVQAPSKQKAKHEASHVAILKLWDMKRNEGKLLPEDEENWTAYELAKEQRMENMIITEPDKNLSTSGPVRLTIYERRNEPVMLLNQLHAQRRLVVDFNILDVSPLTLLTTEFKCKCSINGQELGVASAISKKKAKIEAAQLALNKALELGIIEWITSPLDRDGD